MLKLFQIAPIENFSSSAIHEHKIGAPLLMTPNWFSSEKASHESSLFFSFTEDQHIDVLFNLIQEFSLNIETKNPIKVVVVPI